MYFGMTFLLFSLVSFFLFLISPLGSAPSTSSSSSSATPQHAWRLGPVYLLDEPLSGSQVQVRVCACVLVDVRAYLALSALGRPYACFCGCSCV